MSSPDTVTPAPDRILYPSNVLRLLRLRGRLGHWLSSIGIDDPQLERALKRLVARRQLPAAELPMPADLDVLRRLVSDRPAPGAVGTAVRAGRLCEGSLHAVQAVNFELTYACNLRCSHCLQDGLRDGPGAGPGDGGLGGWADAALFSRAIEDAALLGLTSLGVNFTGGEVFLPGSPLQALLETTQQLGIPVRVNTNGWWGRSRTIGVGDRVFDGPEAVVEWLKAAGVAMLALSYDQRYRQYPSLWDTVVEIVRICERQGQVYDIVCTGVSGADLQTCLTDLQRRVGQPLHHLQVTAMETVDLGAAAGPPRMTTDAEVRGRLAGTDCTLLGFFRPSFLHVAPDGGVRSCLYASGAGWLGNLRNETFFDITERYPENPVVELFSSKDLPKRAAALLPADGTAARRLRHPCAVAAALAGEAGKQPGASAQTGTSACAKAGTTHCCTPASTTNKPT